MNGFWDVVLLILAVFFLCDGVKDIFSVIRGDKKGDVFDLLLCTVEVVGSILLLKDLLFS